MDYPYGAINIHGEPEVVSTIIKKAKIFNGTSVSDYYNNGDQAGANIVAHMNYLGELATTCKALGASYEPVLPMVNYQQVENSMW